MSELVIGGVLFGVAYLLSNQDPQPEGMSNIEQDTTTFKNNHLKSKLNMKYTDSTTSHQKHMTTQKAPMTHNNMKPFYKNKSNGHQFEDTAIDSILDHHTGGGSNAIEKQEKSAFFKPTDNMQNVYGNKSNTDFMQSRVNGSSKYGNTKPWEEIHEAPGTMGFNNAYQYRQESTGKSVDELRTLNNPKVSYENNYQAPAYKPKDYNPMALGKVAHKKPDTYHVNNNIEAFGAPRGNIRTVAKPQQMMTNENREDTSVSYFGVKGANSTTYKTPSEKTEVHKVQLPATQLSNLSGAGIHPEQSHGREGFSSLANNRTVNNMGEYFGNVKNNLYSNVVSPIVNTMRPTKKGETIHNHHMGNINNTVINPTPHTANDLPTTNREMNPHSLNHMNVQNQSSDGYKVSNPYVIGTQRTTTNHSHVGGAKGVNLISETNPSYSPMIDKTVEERAPVGNTNMFNNQINVNLQSRERENTRQSAIYNPNDIQIVGNNTRITQEYENKQNVDESLVQAFKNNPYTHSLHSVA